MGAHDRRGSKSKPWIVAAIALALLAALGAAFVAFDPLGMRETDTPADTPGPIADGSHEPTGTVAGDEATATPLPAGWAIAFVTDPGIVTMREDGSTTTVATLTGQTADWAPDRSRVVMLQYSRADMAYVNDLAIVEYPSGGIAMPFKGSRGQIEYYGWASDGRGVVWSDAGGEFWRADAVTGAESRLTEAPEEPSLPPIPEGDVEDAIVDAVSARLDPPADGGTEVFVVGAWPSADGALLLVDMEVWRGADQEAAQMRRETSIWLADTDGSDLRYLGEGRSPTWLSE